MDLEKATYTNSVGSVELKTVWTDPEFDSSLHAFYYARVLEIPTPRWTLIQAVKAGLPPPDVVPLTGQERAWTSPIWYTPSVEARKNAPAGMTVADLKKKGATALGDAQLKSLIVGKSFWVRNNPTGEQFSQSFTAEGQTTVFHVGRNANVPSGFGSVVRDGYQGTTTPYKIEGSKSSSPTYRQDAFALTVYKLGDTYYGARNNEFGYANYEIIPTPLIAVNPLTELINQVSIELGLTEQQKLQVAPILKQELQQLATLKKGRVAECAAEGGEVEADRRRDRCPGHTPSESGAAAEVPDAARRGATANDREDGDPGSGQAGERGQAEVVGGSGDPEPSPAAAHPRWGAGHETGDRAWSEEPEPNHSTEEPHSTAGRPFGMGAPGIEPGTPAV